jgi:hypothetical protein
MAKKGTDVIKHMLLISSLLFAVAGLCLPAYAGAPVHLRINTSHGLSNALGAVSDAGLSVIDDVIISPSSEFNGRPFLAPDAFMLDALATHATIMSSSFSNWDHLYDTAYYLKLTQKNLVHVFAYEPRKPQPPHAPPPAVFATVNLSGGTTGGGIEFGIPKGYMNGRGQSDSASGVTAQLAGLMASLKCNHPAWNWFDVKAALRLTASNFLNGYNPDTSGYGTIDYRSANAQKDAGQFPLFPPAALMRTTKNNTVVFAINSYKQTRRVADALFRFRMCPRTSLKELSLAELNAMGGQLLFTGDRSETTNSVALHLANNEMTYFVWLGKDARGRYSRLESYSILGPVLFTPANK